MSTYDDASLVLVPSGYKNGIVFSQKPMDANGQLTFTRASSATRVQSDGLIEKVRTNLLLQSVWPNIGTGVAPTSWAASTTNFSAGPLAGQLLCNTSASRGFITQSVSLTAGQYALSVFVDSVTTSGQINQMISIFGATSLKYYEDGIEVSGTASIVAGKRYAVVGTVTTGSFSMRIGSGVDANATNNFVISRPQLEVSDFGATDYIPTTTTAVSVGPVSGLPRLDYLGSTCPRLLLEPQRTNFLLNNLSIIGNTTSGQATPIVSPDGYENGRLPIPSSTASRFEFIFAGGTFASGTVLTYSWFVKTVSTPASPSPTTGQLTQFTASVNATAGTPTKMADYGNGWERWSITYTVVNGAVNSTLRAYYGGVIGIGNSSVAYYGHQVEQGTYATSLIINQSAAVTRVADAASKTGISSLIGQTEGAFYAEWEVTQADGGVYEISLSDGSASNAVRLRQNSSNTMQLVVASSGAVVASISSGTTIVVGQRYKLAAAYKLNDFVFYLNGTQVGSDSSGAVPATLTSIGTSRGDGNFPFYGELNQALIFKTRLDNATLQSLTTL
jgi:hypothetical protein